MLRHQLPCDMAKYTTKVSTPIYEPKTACPDIESLIDTDMTKRLLDEIDKANLPDAEKAFLRTAAQRHTVFNYAKVADYYAHASPEMQRCMENSALVIVDFGKAIERGFLKLREDVKALYLQELQDAPK